MIPECERVPLDTDNQPVTGWRCWFVLPHERLLRPIYRRGLAWKPRQATEAICPDELHKPPADGCKCGIRAVSEPQFLKQVHWTTAPPDGVAPLPGILVVGQVAMWGEIEVYDRGWRSSHAYPKHLYVFTENPELAAALRDKYLVPVEYGEKAELLRRLLPAAVVTPPAPVVPPSASSSS